MRAFITTTVLALALSACGRGGTNGNAVNQSESVGVNSIASNDVTAIDAVTADDANMAADVPFDNSVDNAADNVSGKRATQTVKQPADRPMSEPSAPSNTAVPTNETNTAQ